MSVHDLDRLLPQTGAMRLVDRVEVLDGSRAVVALDVVPGALFADDDGLPAWVALEAMAQAMAVWIGGQGAGDGGPPRAGLLVGTRRFEARVPRFPFGTTLHVEAVPEAGGAGGLTAFACTVRDAAAPAGAPPWCEAVVLAYLATDGTDTAAGGAG